MPNWAAGDLKIRGKKDDLLNFLQNGLEAQLTPGEQMTALENGIKNPEPTLKIKFEDEGNGIYNLFSPNYFYIKNTKRAFIQVGGFDVSLGDRDEEQIIVIPEFRQAWSICKEDFKQISDKFNIDIKNYAFEPGGQFNTELEVVKGEVTVYKSYSYDNYDWDSPMSTIGG